jgi:hypothetical protein
LQPSAFQEREIEQRAIRAAGARLGGRVAKIVRQLEARERHRI